MYPMAGVIGTRPLPLYAERKLIMSSRRKSLLVAPVVFLALLTGLCGNRRFVSGILAADGAANAQGPHGNSQPRADGIEDWLRESEEFHRMTSGKIPVIGRLNREEMRRQGQIYANGYYGEKAAAGSAHPTLPHLVSAGPGKGWLPAPGYDWLDRNNFTVVWKPGVGHLLYDHVVASETEGQLVPEPGYEWDDPKKLSVRPATAGSVHPTCPHVVSAGEGRGWRPEPGYDWEDREKLTVAWKPGVGTPYPHVVASETEGRLVPENGYHWTYPDICTESDVTVNFLRLPPLPKLDIIFSVTVNVNSNNNNGRTDHNYNGGGSSNSGNGGSSKCNSIAGKIGGGGHGGHGGGSGGGSGGKDTKK
jgi:hypothetical protein